jgi:DNA-binding NarL/FixJ family response regulator
VAAVPDGPAAWQAVRSAVPDVLLLDLGLPGLDGVEVARRVRSISPQTRVVALTAHDEQAYVLAMLEAGAAGYLSKASRGQEVVQAVRAAAAGEAVFSGGIGAQLTRRALGGAHSAHTDLTPRELDVLRAAARGLGNKQIGQELGMSPRTVQTHLTRIFGKLGVASRTEAVLLALREGLIDVRDTERGAP